ncbi:Protein phosphatase 2C [Trichinella spiralis]|uniref:Protein phosphatase 2C n=1 Tax=Trichinella spiralis TaxID=6334 RepID=A0ABR3K180_TRISP
MAQVQNILSLKRKMLGAFSRVCLRNTIFYCAQVGPPPSVVSVAGGTVHGLFPSHWYLITSSGRVNVQFWFFIHYQPGIQGSGGNFAKLYNIPSPKTTVVDRLSNKESVMSPT